MVAKGVAREADVSATAGSALYTGATSGSWSAGQVSLTTASIATSDGSKIVTKASCTFSFTGSAGQTAVTGSSSITLEPRSRLLTIGGSAPLVDGDSAKDSYGNTVSVASGASWRTA